MSNFKFFEKARVLNQKHHEELKQNKCHFRGSFGGVSFISLDQERPELGLSKIDVNRSLKSMVEELSGKTPGRVTPEKKVQAALIYDVIYGTPPKFWKQYQLCFLTSELRLKIPLCCQLEGKNTSSITNDILAIDSDGRIWIVELKSKRALKELKRQLNDFKTVIEAQKDIQGIIKQLNPDTPWNGKGFRKMIVWPKGAAKKTTESLTEENIVTIGYSPNGDHFEYAMEVE